MQGCFWGKKGEKKKAKRAPTRPPCPPQADLQAVSPLLELAGHHPRAGALQVRAQAGVPGGAGAAPRAGPPALRQALLPLSPPSDPKRASGFGFGAVWGGFVFFFSPRCWFRPFLSVVALTALVLGELLVLG